MCNLFGRVSILGWGYFRFTSCPFEIVSHFPGCLFQTRCELCCLRRGDALRNLLYLRFSQHRQLHYQPQSVSTYSDLRNWMWRACDFSHFYYLLLDCCLLTLFSKENYSKISKVLIPNLLMSTNFATYFYFSPMNLKVQLNHLLTYFQIEN